MGIGGGPEGVIVATALDKLKCKFQCRFLFNSKEDIKRAKQMGIMDLNKKYEINEIVEEIVYFVRQELQCELMMV